MKAIYILFLLFFIVKTSYSQYDCTYGRFVNQNYFDSVQMTSDILFGENINVAGSGVQQLYLDFFEPYGDPLSKRPLLILTFGGSFVGGNRHDIHALCKAYAKMGYTTAAIDYRVGYFFPVTEVNTTNAVIRAMHDMKAAVRFFKKNASVYKVDTSLFIVGGVSAGAITALHTAFLNKESEVPAYIDASGIGGEQGLSGNPGYSTRVHGVLNFSGAIGDTTWLEYGDHIAIFSVHDTGDVIVPFKTKEVLFGGVYPTGLWASGSKDIHKRAIDINEVSHLTQYNTSGHVSYFMDSVNTLIVFSESAVFMEDHLVCKYPVKVPELTPVEDAHVGFKIYPNPALNSISITSLSEQDDLFSVSVYELGGKLAWHTDYFHNGSDLDISAFKTGNYVVKVNNGERFFSYTFIKQ